MSATRKAVGRPRLDKRGGRSVQVAIRFGEKDYETLVLALEAANRRLVADGHPGTINLSTLLRFWVMQRLDEEMGQQIANRRK